MAIKTKKFGVKFGITLASSLAILTSTIATQRVLAQEDTAAEENNIEEVIVTGTRQNLQNAQDIKRDADTFVDAISATDIGSLPDRSVLEAMQRLPGVSIERFAAANDPDHFGVEGSGAVVRGMTQTRSEFNGRDSFTANSGRGLSFQDVPPELMGGVEMYKNQTADMVEGGIGGTVNLKTRLPFDNRGMQAAASVDYTYGDMVEDWTPTFSGLYSNTWETDAGEFGFLINLARSELSASSHGIQTDLYEVRSVAPGNITPGFPNAPAGAANVLVPNGANLTMKVDDRERNGYAAAFQWANPDDTLVATVQFMRSDATLAWTENALKYQSGYYSNRSFAPDPVVGDEDISNAQFEFDDRGIFTSGTFTDIADGWRGDGDRIPHNVYNGDWGGTPVKNFGMQFQTDARYKKTRTVVDDLAFNIEYEFSDSWLLSFDVQHIEASTNDDDVTLMLGTHAIQSYDVRGNGDTPSLNVYDAWEFFDDTDDSYSWDGNPNYLQDPTSYYWRAAMDHYERSEGESNAVRIDLTHEFSDGLFTKVMFGARMADRDQDVRSSAYNWGQLQAPWGPPTYVRDENGEVVLNNDNPLTPQILYPSGAGWLDSARATDANLGIEATDYVNWGDFFRGGVVDIEGQGADMHNQLLHPSTALTRNYSNWQTILNPVSNEWQGSAFRDVDNNGTIDTIPGTFFLPWEINSVGESNQSLYVRFDFEGDAPLRFNGNFGLRWVKIEHDVVGSTIFPNQTPEYPLPADFDWDNWNTFVDSQTIPRDGNGDLAPEFDADGVVTNRGNYYNNDDYNTFYPQIVASLEDPRAIGDYRNFLNYLYPGVREFATGVAVEENTKTSETHLLPSLNVKVEFTDELVGRFAIGKAIALPDMGDLRAQKTLGVIGDTISSQYLGQDDSNAGASPSEIRPVNPYSLQFGGWKATGGNPELKAMESTQLDMSLEWYFADVGSLTTSLFHKELKNFFINGGQYENYINPVTAEPATVIAATPRNAGDGKMSGVEFAYQQFFDMLPEPWDSLGVQMNYTYIKASGAPNYDAVPTEVYQNATVASEVNFGDLPLQGQSKNTSNVVLMYENDVFNARIAYNWRSKYLLTTRDVITKLPIYNEAAGFMDASVFYNITDQIKVGIQGVNLLNTQTETLAQIDAEGTTVGRSWFVNDRRYTLVLRANF